VVQQYEYSTGLSKDLCRMFEHLHCKAHGIKGRIMQHDDAVVEFTLEVKVLPHAMQRKVCQYPMKMRQHPMKVCQHPMKVCQHPMKVHQHTIKVRQHPMHSRSFIVLHSDIIELLKKDPQVLY